MNLFIVPSWYPSATNPSYGIFVKEQIGMLAKEKPSWKIGVSTWGQGDNEKLIWLKDHFRNVSKFTRHGDDSAKETALNGFTEYYQPALSWTKKLRKGNIEEIIRCNELNYQAHTLKHGKPNAILVQACYPGALIADYLSSKYEVPNCLHIRLGGFMFEYMLNELGGMKKELLGAIRNASIVTCTSEFQREELSAWITNTRVVHNPVDLSHFEVKTSNEGYAMAIGRLEEEKGFDLLINAMVGVPELKLKIAGTGSQLKKLVNQAKTLGLDERIAFVGEADRNDVKELIQRSKFLVLPSRYESFGNVLLEAMACGKPVVATMCGGPEEIVRSDVGYLSQKTEEALSEKIKQMDKSYESFNSQVIRKYVEDHFSPVSWASSLEVILSEIVKK